MGTFKKLSRELIEINKNKQRALNSAGYNVKVDGSWGPWLEKLYRKVISRVNRNPNLANVGVMALPVAGYGAAQLLEGLGSVSLPSISIPSAYALTMAAPVALTLAGPAYGMYERVTGKYPKIAPLTPYERQALVYAPDATRVSRPIALDFPRKVKSGPIGERYINPILSRAASRSRQLATDTTATASGDSILAFLEELVQATSRNTTAASPSQEPLNNEDKKKDKKGNSNSWFKLWEGSGTSNNPNFWRHVRNYGIRVPLYTGIAAPAIDIVGNMASASKEPEGLAHQWVWPLTSKRFSLEKGTWKLFGDAYSTPVDSTSRDSSLIALPTNSLQVQLSQHVVPQAINGVIQAEDMSAVIDSILGI